jgi:Tfp pilus assembly PilM family ATPase
MISLIKGKNQHGWMKFFPVPDFLRMKAAGLDIKDSGLYLVDFFYKRGNLRPRVILEKKLNEGIIVHGEIKRREDLLLALKDVRLKADTDLVYASFPDEKTYFYEMNIPINLSESEVRNYVEFHLDENVPINPKETVFDFVLQERGKFKQRFAHICATSSRDVEAYADVLKVAGLLPIGLCPSSQAAAEAIIDETEAANIMILLGNKKTYISIVEYGVVSFVSVVSVSGMDIAEAVKEHINLDLEKWRGILSVNDTSQSQSTKGSVETKTSAMSILEDEIQKILSYAESRGKKSSDIRRIFLLGKYASTPNLEEYISHITGKPASVANVWSKIIGLDNYVPSINFQDSLDYVSASGLALQSYV